MLIGQIIGGVVWFVSCIAIGLSSFTIDKSNSTLFDALFFLPWPYNLRVVASILSFTAGEEKTLDNLQ
jgi:hypothetical protein